MGLGHRAFLPTTWRQRGFEPAPGQDNGLIRRCLTEDGLSPRVTFRGRLQELQHQLNDIRGMTMAKAETKKSLKIKNKVTKQGNEGKYFTPAAPAVTFPTSVRQY